MMKIFEFRLKKGHESFGGGEYNSMVVIAADVDSAVTLSSMIDEYGDECSCPQWGTGYGNTKNRYDIKELGTCDESLPRFVTGYYVPYNNNLDD